MADVTLTVEAEMGSSWGTIQSQIESMINSLSAKPVVIDVVIGKNELEKLQSTLTGMGKGSGVKSLSKGMASAAASTKRASNGVKSLNAEMISCQEAAKQISAAVKEVTDNTNKWKSLSTGKTSGTYQLYADQVKALNDLNDAYSTGLISAEQFGEQYAQIQDTIAEYGKSLETSMKSSIQGTIQELQVAQKEIDTAYNQMYKALGGATATGENKAAIESMRQQYIELKSAMDEVKHSQDELNSGDVENVRALQTQNKALIDSMKDRVTAQKEITAAEKESADVIKQVDTAMQEVTANTEKWKDLETGKNADTYKQYSDQALALESLKSAYEDGRVSLEGFNEQFAQIESTMSTSGKALETSMKSSMQATMQELQVAQREIDSMYSSMYKELGGATATGENKSQIETMRQSYLELKEAMNEVKNAQKDMNMGDTDNVRKLQSDNKALIESMKERLDAQKQLNEAEKEAEAGSQEATIKQEEQMQRAYASALQQSEKALRNNTNAQHSYNSAAREAYSNIQQEQKSLESMYASYDKTAASAQALTDESSRLKSTVNASQAVFTETGTAGQTLGSTLGGLSSKFLSWFTVSQGIMTAVRGVRSMVSESVALDDSMTQLKIVTDESDAAYTQYGKDISQTAQNIGSSITDLVDSTTTYARLGYDLSESSSLAEYTAMLQNVGDIDVADAQSAMTGIIKAYDMNADDVESVMDKMVAVGNNFPISVSEIAEGMNNASSTMAASGNSFDETVALLTAANTTIQDASKSSTGLRTIAARIRNTKTELDDLGETMTDANYQDLVSTLTDANVQLMDANGEYRSTYDIMSDIAGQWNDMTSGEQAAMATALSGTRQQAVFYSIIDQFQEASDAMDVMSDSAGTLDEAYGTWSDSTTAHVKTFNAAFQQLGSDFFSSDFMKGVVDTGTTAVNTVDNLTDSFGGLGTVAGMTIAGIIGGGVGTMVSAGATGGLAALGAAIGPVGAVAAGISGIVLAYSTWQQHEKALVEDMQADTSTYRDQISSLDDYKTEISSLQGSLESGTLSEEESYQTKSQLLSIQRDLNDTYSSAAQGIDLVNESLDDQSDAFSKMAASDARDYLQELTPTQRNRATNQMEKQRQYVLGEYFNDEASEASKQIDQIVDDLNTQYGDVIEKSFDPISGSTTLTFVGDATQADETLSDFMGRVYDASEEVGQNQLFDDLYNGASVGLKDADKALEKYKDTYDAMADAQLYSDPNTYDILNNGEGKAAAEWISDYAQAIDDYNQALSDGDFGEIREARDNFNEIDDALSNSSFAERYAKQIGEVSDELNDTAKASYDFIDAATGQSDAVNETTKAYKEQGDAVKDLGLDAYQFADIAMGLEDKTGNYSKSAVESVQKLRDSAEAFGALTKDENGDFDSSEVLNFAKSMASAGLLVDNTTDSIDDSTESLESLQERYSTFGTNMSNIQSALSESMSGTGLSADGVSSLVSAFKDLDGYDYGTLFQNTANGVRLNTDALKLLNEEYANDEMLKVGERLQYMAGQYEDTANEMAALEESDSAYGSRYNELKSNLEDYGSEIQSLQTLQSEYQGLTSDYNTWQNALSSSNEKDTYAAIGESYDSMKQILDSGWVNNDDLNSYLDMMLSAEQRTGDAQADFDKLNQTIEGTDHSLRDYWQYDEETGSLIADGVKEFVSDVGNVFGETVAGIDEAGNQFLDLSDDNLKNIADWAGTTTENIERMGMAAEEAGVEVTFPDMNVSNLDELQSSVDASKKGLEELSLSSQDLSESVSSALSDTNFDFDLDNMSLDDVDDAIEKVSNKKAEIETEVVTEGDQEALGDLDSMISSLNQERVTLSVETAIEDGATYDELLEMDSEDLSTTLGIEVEEGDLDSVKGRIEELKSEAESVSDISMSFAVDQAMDDGSKVIESIANGEMDEVEISARYNIEGEDEIADFRSLVGDTYTITCAVESAVGNGEYSLDYLQSLGGDDLKQTLEIETELEGEDVEAVVDSISEEDIEIPVTVKLEESQFDELAGIEPEEEITETVTFEADEGSLEASVPDEAGTSKVELEADEANLEGSVPDEAGTSKVELEADEANLEGSVPDEAGTSKVTLEADEANLEGSVPDEAGTSKVTLEADDAGLEGSVPEEAGTSKVTLEADDSSLEGSIPEDAGTATVTIEADESGVDFTPPTVEPVQVDFVLGDTSAVEGFTPPTVEPVQVDFTIGDSSSVEGFTPPTVPDVRVNFTRGDTSSVDGYTPPNPPDVRVNFTRGDTSSVDGYTPPSPPSVQVNFTLGDTSAVDGYTPATPPEVQVNFTLGDTSAVDGYAPPTPPSVTVNFVRGDTSSVDSYSPPSPPSATVNFVLGDTSGPDGYQPADKTATAHFQVDSSGPDGYQPSDKTATVHYVADTGGLPESFPAITRTVNYVATGAVSVSGTAHAEGTAKAKGDWGAKQNGMALGGELGRELVVRDGRFFTIGDQSAEFFDYRKGDIIFNADQTRQIFEKGKITQGRKRGTALADGTLPPNFTAISSGKSFSDGTAFAGGTSQTSGYAFADGDDEDTPLDKFKEWFEKLFDWIEVRLERQTRKIENYIKKADAALDEGSYKTSRRNYRAGIRATGRQMDYENEASSKYMKEANKVLSKGVELDTITQDQADSIARKVKDGTMRISEYSEEVRELISSYTEWYEKSLDAKDALIDLKDKLREYVDAIKDTIDAQRDLKVSTYENYKTIGTGGLATTVGEQNSQVSVEIKQLRKQERSNTGAAHRNERQINYKNNGTIARTAYNSTSTRGVSSNKYRKALKKARKLIKQQKKIPSNVMSVVKKYSYSTWANLYSYNQALDNAQTAREEQALARAESEVEKVTAMSDRYTNKNDSLESKIDLARMRASNATSVSKSNKYLDRAANRYDTIVQTDKAAVKRFNKLANRKTDTILNTTAKTKNLGNADKSTQKKVKKAIKNARKRAKAGKAISEKTMDNLYKYYTKGYIKWTFYKACYDYNQALAEKEEWEAQLEIDEETAKSEKAAIGTEEFENVEQKYTNKRNDINAQQDILTAQQNLKEAQNEKLTADDYREQLTLSQKEQKTYENEITALQKQIEDNLSKGYWTTASQEYLDAMQSVYDYEAEVYNCAAAQEELYDSIWQCMVEPFEEAAEKLQDIIDMIEKISGLLTSDNFVNDDGTFSQEGLAQIKLALDQIDQAAASVQEYQDALEELDRLYDSGQLGLSEGEYYDKRLEYQQAMLDAAADEKAAIESLSDLWQEAAQKELDSINELIDARRKALDEKKNYYDYDKSIRSQTADIQSLEAQIAALEGVETAAARAKRTTLEAELAEKQSDLEDTVADHYYDLSDQALSDLSDLLQDNFDEKWDHLWEDFANIEAIISEANDLTSASAEMINDTLNRILGYYGIDANTSGISSYYASGTRKVTQSGLALTNENGGEMIVTKDGILMPLEYGDGVIPADLTAKLYELAESGKLSTPVLNTPSLKIPDIKVGSNGRVQVEQHYDSLITIEGSADAATVDDLKNMKDDLLVQSYEYTRKQNYRKFQDAGGKRRI